MLIPKGYLSFVFVFKFREIEIVLRWKLMKINFCTIPYFFFDMLLVDMRMQTQHNYVICFNNSKLYKVAMTYNIKMPQRDINALILLAFSFKTATSNSTFNFAICLFFRLVSCVRTGVIPIVKTIIFLILLETFWNNKHLCCF